MLSLASRQYSQGLIQTRYGGGAGDALAVEKGFGVKGGGADAQQRR
jgi:hypothetical protein